MVSARVQGIDVGAIERAVREAERGTSAEIRVAIPRFFWWGDVRRAAQDAFAALGMERTRERNAVLLYISPRRRRFAIVGDVGVHARVTGAFWDELAVRVADALRARVLTEAVQSAVTEIGARLAALFPAPAGENVNELPDTVTR